MRSIFYNKIELSSMVKRHFESFGKSKHAARSYRKQDGDTTAIDLLYLLKNFTFEALAWHSSR